MNDKIDMKTIFIDKMGVDYERLEKFAFMVLCVLAKKHKMKYRHIRYRL